MCDKIAPVAAHAAKKKEREEGDNEQDDDDGRQMQEIRLVSATRDPPSPVSQPILWPLFSRPEDQERITQRDSPACLTFLQQKHMLLSGW